MSACIIDYIARGYWERAQHLSIVTRRIPDLSIIWTEDAMDLCAEMYHTRGPDWLKSRAQRFSELRSAQLSSHYETLLDQHQTHV